MNKFLERYNLPTQNHESTKKIQLILSNEVESIIKNLPKKKSLRPDGSLVNSTKNIKKN